VSSTDQAGGAAQAPEIAQAPAPPEWSAAVPAWTPGYSAPAPSQPRGGRSSLAPLAAIGALFLVLMVAASAAVVVVNPRGQTTATGSPSAALQAWSSAMQAGNFSTADTYLSSSLRADGTTSQSLVQSMTFVGLTVDNVSITGNSATVQAELTIGFVPGDSSTNYTMTCSVAMVMEGGGWKIDAFNFNSPV
jgi:hypothetical protein